jgi:hypothetical protein
MSKTTQYSFIAILLLGTTTLSAYAPALRPGESPTPAPYTNPAYNQGLSTRDSSTLYSDGNLVRDISDKTISDEIHAILTSGFFTEGYQNITYSVQDGIVTLRGHVTTPDNKIKLEDRIRQIKGVILIDNQISIFGSDNKLPQ